MQLTSLPDPCEGALLAKRAKCTVYKSLDGRQHKTLGVLFCKRLWAKGKREGIVRHWEAIGRNRTSCFLLVWKLKFGEEELLIMLRGKGATKETKESLQRRHKVNLD